MEDELDIWQNYDGDRTPGPTGLEVADPAWLTAAEDDSHWSRDEIMEEALWCNDSPCTLTGLEDTGQNVAVHLQKIVKQGAQKDV